MPEEHTTAVVQRYLEEWDSNSPVESPIREVLNRSVQRLHLLCANLLFRSYPRLTRPPLNLRAEEMLSAVVERLIKALRQTRPQNVRQFFALANQHVRWELNDLARRLDNQTVPVELHDSISEAPPSHSSQLSSNAHRMLETIEKLPEDEREAFSLVRIQGIPQTEAAQILNVSPKTVQRRINRAVLVLADELDDLRPAD
jgi:RNA polymerase sigma factor (sigma-70 family)